MSKKAHKQTIQDQQEWSNADKSSGVGDMNARMDVLSGDINYSFDDVNAQMDLSTTIRQTGESIVALLKELANQGWYIPVTNYEPCTQFVNQENADCKVRYTTVHETELIQKKESMLETEPINKTEAPEAYQLNNKKDWMQKQDRDTCYVQKEEHVLFVSKLAELSPKVTGVKEKQTEDQLYESYQETTSDASNSIKKMQESRNDDLRVGATIIPIFEGVYPYSWVAMVEKYFRCGDYGDDAKLELVSRSFEGEARTWYNRENKQNSFANWEELKEKLLAQFRGVTRRSWPEKIMKKESIMEGMTHEKEKKYTRKKTADKEEIIEESIQNIGSMEFKKIGNKEILVRKQLVMVMTQRKDVLVAALTENSTSVYVQLNAHQLFKKMLFRGRSEKQKKMQRKFRFKNNDLQKIGLHLRMWKSTHVDGVNVTLVWGITEGLFCKKYSWKGYRQFARMFCDHNLTMQWYVKNLWKCIINTVESKNFLEMLREKDNAFDLVLSDVEMYAAGRPVHAHRTK